MNGAELLQRYATGERAFVGEQLTRVSLRDAVLAGIDLREADLWEADLCGADLCGANLSGAYMREALLFEAKLCCARLCDADCHEADFAEADFAGADVSGARLVDADLLALLQSRLAHAPFTPRVATKVHPPATDLKLADAQSWGDALRGLS